MDTYCCVLFFFTEWNADIFEMGKLFQVPCVHIVLIN